MTEAAYVPSEIVYHHGTEGLVLLVLTVALLVAAIALMLGGGSNK